MPIKKSAKKALRQSKKRMLANIKQRRQLEELIKKATAQIKVKEKEAATTVKAAYQAIDKATKRGILKRNTASRRKSSLMRQLNKILKG